MSKARRPYLIGLVEGNRPGEYPRPPYCSRTWSVDVIVHRYTETPDKRGNPRYSPNYLEYGEPTMMMESKRIKKNTARHTLMPILVVWAERRIVAQEAANNIVAAHCVLEGYQSLDLDDAIAIPKSGDDFEDLDEITYLPRRNTRHCTSGFANAAAIAAKCSHRRQLTYALLKIWASLRTCSTHWMDFHPLHGRFIGVTPSPLSHIVFSQAILSAYSAIEELGFAPPSYKGAYIDRILQENQRRT